MDENWVDKIIKFAQWSPDDSPSKIPGQSPDDLIRSIGQSIVPPDAAHDPPFHELAVHLAEIAEHTKALELSLIHIFRLRLILVRSKVAPQVAQVQIAVALAIVLTPFFRPYRSNFVENRGLPCFVIYIISQYWHIVKCNLPILAKKNKGRQAEAHRQKGGNYDRSM